VQPTIGPPEEPTIKVKPEILRRAVFAGELIVINLLPEMIVFPTPAPISWTGLLSDRVPLQVAEPAETLILSPSLAERTQRSTEL
jgi:hypothetical protein